MTPAPPQKEIESLAEQFTDELMYLEECADPYPGSHATVMKFLTKAYDLAVQETRQQDAQIARRTMLAYERKPLEMLSVYADAIADEILAASLQAGVPQRTTEAK